MDLESILVDCQFLGRIMGVLHHCECLNQNAHGVFRSATRKGVGGRFDDEVGCEARLKNEAII